MDNGRMPAMPFVVPSDVTMQPCNGLTKREMMAMHMMSGLLASDTRASHLEFASESVKAADALLTELERTCHKT